MKINHLRKNNVFKLISYVLVFLFVFQANFALSQEGKTDANIQLEQAKQEFEEGKYEIAKKRLKRLILILNKKIEWEKRLLMEANALLKAIWMELQPKNNVLVKEGRKKKKFPVFLVVGGVIVIVLAILLFKKKKTEAISYTLTTTRGSGIDGTPNTGTTTHNQGSTVSYNYSLQSGYTNLMVTLDGATVSSSGTVTMNANHTLTASATPPVNRYALSVTKGSGVDGTPDTGDTTYDEGAVVNYNYTLQNGYRNLVVTLDGSTVSASGTITMDADHTLSASATSTGPTVTITSHNNGDTVSGRIDIEGLVQSSNGISRVDLLVDGIVIRSNNESSFSLRWNTNNWADGTHTVRVVAYDSDNVSGEAQVSLIVDNDVQITVNITSPQNNSPVTHGDNVTIEATASSAAGITRVEFYVDDVLLSTDTSSPYSASWDTSSYLEGSHVVRVVAYDSTGNSNSTNITVNITAQL